MTCLITLGLNNKYNHSKIQLLSEPIVYVYEKVFSKYVGKFVNTLTHKTHIFNTAVTAKGGRPSSLLTHDLVQMSHRNVICLEFFLPTFFRVIQHRVH